MAHVVAAVIYREGASGQREYLLVSTKKDYGKQTGFLQPTAGHMEAGETEEEALKREVQEELGVGIKSSQKLVDLPGDVPNYTVHWWECELAHFNFTIEEDEISKTYWLTKSDLTHRSDVWPATKSFFWSFLANKNPYFFSDRLISASISRFTFSDSSVIFCSISSLCFFK